MRCGVCGLVVRDASGQLTEARNAREEALNLSCSQCVEDFKALLAEPRLEEIALEDGTIVTADTGEPLHTNEQAMHRARMMFYAREETADGERRMNILRNIAAGKHGETGAAKVAFKATEALLTQADRDAGKLSQEGIDAGKAQAQAFLDDLEKVPLGAKAVADAWAAEVLK